MEWASCRQDDHRIRGRLQGLFLEDTPNAVQGKKEESKREQQHDKGELDGYEASRQYRQKCGTQSQQERLEMLVFILAGRRAR